MLSVGAESYESAMWGAQQKVGSRRCCTHHLAFLLIFQLLVQLSQTRRPFMVRTMWPRARA